MGIRVRVVVIDASAYPAINSRVAHRHTQHPWLRFTGFSPDTKTLKFPLTMAPSNPWYQHCTAHLQREATPYQNRWIFAVASTSSGGVYFLNKTLCCRFSSTLRLYLTIKNIYKSNIFHTKKTLEVKLSSEIATGRCKTRGRFQQIIRVGLRRLG